MIKLSAVIITFNEEKNIGRCIDSLIGIADEIVVVDSFSSDRTKEICLAKGAKFTENKFEGYSEQKNFGSSISSHPYILSLDADEALSEQLRASIIKAKEDWQFDGYNMNRITNYCGQWIKHCGWYPDTKLRLYDRRQGQWDDSALHEKYIVKSNKTGLLEGDILHYSFYTITEHLKQVNNYTDIASLDLFKRGKKVSTFKIVFAPLIKFFRDYFILLGVLDGFYGFVICKISAHATFLKYAKLKALWKEKK